MPDLASATGEESAVGRRFAAFRAGERLYALAAEEIAEVARVSSLARVPQAPAALLGLTNLRGRVTPVASLRALVGEEAGSGALGGLALFLAGSAPVAIAIDSTPVLVDVTDIRTDDAAIVARPEEHVIGVFSAGGELARVLDIQALLRGAFTVRTSAAPQTRTAAASRALPLQNEETEQKLISFLVAGQEFALELDVVREVITAPEVFASVPHAEDLVVGVTAYRDTLLPLLSLRGLLGLPPASSAAAKVVVSRIGGALVGLVADQAKAIVSVGEGQSDPRPAVLTARSGAESQIKAIFRGDAGRRLISILSPHQLFRGDVMQRLAKAHPAREAMSDTMDDVETSADQFLVFRLCDDEFALPIAAVIEVARVPDVIARVPKTPEFLEGVMSLRGDVLPVVDQRRRFDMPRRAADAGRRLVIVRSERHKAALIVDSVSELLSCPRDTIGAAPNLTGQQTQLMLGVINLEAAGRMIMVLDPAELLNRAERGLLDAFTPDLAETR